ncbi:peptidase T2, asparaginase 2 [Martensiomyces pterosporus]|nr:peptidase T2, asparaginase 2 [Martensiomyces pterosporus]
MDTYSPGCTSLLSRGLSKLFGGSSKGASVVGARPTIVIHGGAGTIRKEKMTPSEEKDLRLGLYRATEQGYAVLMKGGSALDAVEAAVRSLEDNPLFNAGKGAVFNIKGVNQLEASIMDGSTGEAGAATLLTVVKNPITLARRVMESNHHVFLGGQGADDYAREKGLDIVDPSYFWTRHRWEQHERGFLAGERDSDQMSQATATQAPPSYLEKDAGEPADYSHLPMGTVGAVAIDANGHLATATSTGGMTNKWVGRIGDTPIIGAGTWADTRVAVSGTGTGEYFIRQNTSHYISSRISLLSESIGKASQTAIREMKKMGGDGGVICIDSSGQFSMTFCSDGMYRGYCSEDTGNVPVVGIFGDEVIAPGDHHVKI